MADPKILSDLSIAPINVNQSAVPSATGTGAGFSRIGPGTGSAAIRRGTDRLGRAGSGGAGAMRFPLDTPKYHFSISISEFGGYTSLGGGPGSVAFNGAGTIVLPLPTPLIDTQEIEYTEYPFGPAWGTFLNAANSDGALNDAMTQARQGDAAGILAAGATAGQGVVDNPAGPAAGAIAGVAGERAAAVAGAFGGFAVNQFYTVLLKGPKYKRYQFSWDLAPRNEDESRMIALIIRTLRAAAAPGLEGAGGIIWDFPYIVQCEFVPQGNGVDTLMYRFKPAVMESVSADYAPFGKPGFYKGTGAPESVKLTIQFLEIEYWLREDF